MKRYALLLIAVLAVCASAKAQTPSNTFSLDAQALSLPYPGHAAAGTLAGGSFAVTPNFSLRSTNLIVPGASFGAYFGGVEYALPVLSGKLNNASPNLAGSQFRFYVQASAGVDRISQAGAPDPAQHIAFLGGGGVDYAPKADGKFSVRLVEVDYAKLPGLANNTVVVSSGVKLSF